MKSKTKLFFGLVIIIFSLYGLNDLKADTILRYRIFGDYYSTVLTEETLNIKENVIKGGKDLEHPLKISKKAKDHLKLKMPSHYVLQVTKICLRKFEIRDNYIWLWEVVFTPHYTIPGEGSTGRGPGKISVFISGSGKIIIPVKDKEKKSRASP